MLIKKLEKEKTIILNSMLIEHLNDFTQSYIERVQTMSSAFMTTVDPHTATYMGQKLIYGQLMQQANLMAFIDAFRVFAIACIVIIPLLFLIKGLKKEN